MFIGKRAKGYMTVEASFIITWTVFLFVFLIYLSFYSYDKCVLFQDAYAVCFRGVSRSRRITLFLISVRICRNNSERNILVRGGTRKRGL